MSETISRQVVPHTSSVQIASPERSQVYHERLVKPYLNDASHLGVGQNKTVNRKVHQNHAGAHTEEGKTRPSLVARGGPFEILRAVKTQNLFSSRKPLIPRNYFLRMGARACACARVWFERGLGVAWAWFGRGFGRQLLRGC